jgi:hypothetical protein
MHEYVANSVTPRTAIEPLCGQSRLEADRALLTWTVSCLGEARQLPYSNVKVIPALLPLKQHHQDSQCRRRTGASGSQIVMHLMGPRQCNNSGALLWMRRLIIAIRAAAWGPAATRELASEGGMAAGTVANQAHYTFLRRKPWPVWAASLPDSLVMMQN